MNIKDTTKRAVLVKVAFSTYAGTVRSKTIAEEAAETHKADVESIKARIEGLRRETLRVVWSKRTAAKAVWREMTLPYEDDGRRMCPVRRYPKLRERLTEIRNEWLEEVQKIVDSHSELKKDAEKRLNGLASELNFPTKEGLAAKYRFDITVSALPSIPDVRFEVIDDELQDQMRKEMAESQGAQIIESQRDVLARAEAVLDTVVGWLSEDSKYAKRIPEKVRNLADLIDDMNVIGSENLTKLAEKLRKEVAVDKVVEDKKAKATVKKTAKKILGELATFKF